MDWYYLLVDGHNFVFIYFLAFFSFVCDALTIAANVLIYVYCTVFYGISSFEINVYL